MCLVKQKSKIFSHLHHNDKSLSVNIKEHVQKYPINIKKVFSSNKMLSRIIMNR